MVSQIYQAIESIFPPIRIIKNYYSKFFGAKRYKYLCETIRNNRCRKIMEIGTWDGEHALQMIREAKKFHGRGVEYYGFDLFEFLDERLCLKEFSKRPPKLKEVARELQKTDCRVRLFRGDTKEVLPKVVEKLPGMDFIFIDGGHSVETIENDWKYAQRLMANHTVVIFDDYWNREDAGCKKVIEEIDRSEFNVEILPIRDRFRGTSGSLRINFVKVQKIKKWE